MNGYKTVTEQYSAELEVKKSRFLANVYPCSSEIAASEILASTRKKYWDARHNVYAFFLHKNKICRFSDDGEPHSTAGLPVMEVIKGFELEDVMVVVTRYFGGVLLGTGGLVRAYSESAKIALGKAQIKRMRPAFIISLKCDYPDYDTLINFLRHSDAQLISNDFSGKITVSAGVAKSNFEDFSKKLADTFCGRISVLQRQETFLGFS